MATPTRRLLVVDADVLIDYATTDLSVLTLASQHLGPVHVPRPILEEVTQLTETVCDRLHLRLLNGTVEQLLEAGRKRGRLSFYDHLCLVLARDAGWTCVTNDKGLRRACHEETVPVLWGLELMIELVSGGHLTSEAAVEVAIAIQVANPLHITADILDRFRQKIGL